MDHFRNLLNHPASSSDDAGIRMHLTDVCPVDDDTANNLITEAEVFIALKSMKNNHGPCVCSIMAKQLKHRGKKIIEWLTLIMNQAWTQLEIPDDWQRDTIIPVWKGKSNHLDCSNYRDISLLLTQAKCSQGFC